MDKHIKPSQISASLHKIANKIEASQNPSKTSVLADIGRVILAVPVYWDDGTSEGKLGCPPAQIIAHLGNYLNAKMAISLAYESFADRIKGPWRDALVDHWYTHAKEEREHKYDLAMRIVGFGGDPSQSIVQIPQCPPNLEGFFRTLMAMEIEAIAAGRETIKLAGDHTSLKVMAENMILIDTQHSDDLKRSSVQFELPI
jgi:bacterioferritin (cytochrome b1)